jgi:hypothetical protein
MEDEAMEDEAWGARSLGNVVRPLPPEVLAKQAELEAEYQAASVREQASQRRAIALGYAVQVIGPHGDAGGVLMAARDFDAFLAGEEKTAAH